MKSQGLYGRTCACVASCHAPRLSQSANKRRTLERLISWERWQGSEAAPSSSYPSWSSIDSVLPVWRGLTMQRCDVATRGWETGAPQPTSHTSTLRATRIENAQHQPLLPRRLPTRFLRKRLRKTGSRWFVIGVDTRQHPKIIYRVPDTQNMFLDSICSSCFAKDRLRPQV
jgi:hypothetical protein